MKIADFLANLLDFGKRDEKGNILLSMDGSTDAARRLDVEELAIFSTIDLVASVASMCEWRTYQNGQRKKGLDWYDWNIAPNDNQSAAVFKRLLVARLLRFNSALVFQRGGKYYLADNFSREERAFRPCRYSAITCNGLTLNYTLEEPDVFYFQLANQDAAQLLAGLNNLYSVAVQEAVEKYQKSGGRHGVLTISTAARSKPTFETDVATLMETRFKKFFEQKNAILPLFEGFSYTPQDGAAAQKSTSEVSDIDSLFRQAQDRACNAYHVAPSLLRGDVSGIDAAIDSTLTFAVKPPLHIIQTEITRKLYGPQAILAGWRLKIDTTHIKAVDVFSMADKIEKLFQNSMYCPNELREKADDDPIPYPWADEYARTKNAETVQGAAANPAADGADAAP